MFCVFIIGVGGVVFVIVKKCVCLFVYFDEIYLVSCMVFKCEVLQKEVGEDCVKGVFVFDVDNVKEVEVFINDVKFDFVINLVLFY